ncbi:RAD3-like DNA-binding helicase protein [Striga hermonthica]|uniref:RAD3-like DNA-binding helicase protein n=1 Tax=Striga hermonthica TaxID=68872 RepID=A0A9N7NVL3_STRHE|nr:RAD3-like DNA-binding helicase protein [Striga hermonthica]
MENSTEIEFPAFPYEPYSIQLDFMKFLYKSLDKGGISMLESPTGTGKTLSMICSALQWLVDRKKQESLENGGEEKSGEVNGKDDEPDWMRNFVPNNGQELTGPKNPLQRNKIGSRPKGNEGAFPDLISPGEGEVEKEMANGKKVKNGVDEVDDHEFLLEEYESDAENEGKSKRKNVGVDDDLSSEGEKFDGEEDEETRLKIFFCSRTHSQLSQFMKELRKTKFASELKVVCLGSRKNFCINEEVVRLGNSARINERCLELQKNKKNEASKMKKLGAGKKVRCNKSSSGCPMLRRRKIEEFRNEVMQREALDIEDLVSIGRNLGGCPYYGSRRMMPAADLVVLPYQSLLSKSSRESLGVNLKNSVVIIDEAHNLADTLISMYDANITVSQLNQLKCHLDGYFRRFRNLLGPGNRRYIQTLMTLARAFLEMLSDDGKVMSHSNPPCEAEEIRSASVTTMTINEFLFALNIDNINLVKLLQYMKESNIIYKISGYGDKVAVSKSSANAEDDKIVIEDESAISGFRALADILSSLINKDSDGKIIVSRPMQTCDGLQGGYIKYVMLTGEKIFSEVLDQAHAVILAGGTLQPIEETKERLFPSLRLEQLPFFACGHVIPSENIIPIAIKYGPSGQSFDFSYKARSSSTMITELGLMISNLVMVVPEGIVVFFSSFDYEKQVHEAWRTSGILSRITKRKRVFREPRKSTEVEAVLREYSEAIEAPAPMGPTSCSGAILFAVVGGKISEGINFSDGMGRCIVMVGLPYPSPSDVELMERVKHIEGLGRVGCGESSIGEGDNGFHVLRSCRGRGKEYYENLCMKAVNQSVGRAIRHINDYAAILLVDARFSSDHTKKSFSPSTDKLPQWIKSHLVATTPNYGEVHSSKFQEKFGESHRSYSEKWDAVEVKKKKKEVWISANAQTKKDERISRRSISFADCRGLEGLKEEKNSRKQSAKKPKGSSFRGADSLARKMKDLEMMNPSDMDHVLDVEEVLHYYSRLKCPTYVEIVDKFFMDMHSEIHVPQPSRSGSMRRHGSTSAHGSMRSLHPIKL